MTCRTVQLELAVTYSSNTGLSVCLSDGLLSLSAFVEVKLRVFLMAF